MRKSVFATMLLVLVLAMSCASLKYNNFLLKNLDDTNKAIALTKQGIAAYTSYLVEQNAYDKTDMVRQYFVVALHYDPANPEAQQYLDKVDNFKTVLAADKLQVAERLLAKPTRQDDENYILIVALLTAAEVDPSNASTAKLLRENTALQVSLVEHYLKSSKESQAKAEKAAVTDPGRETMYINSFDAAVKASTLAPTNAQVTKQKLTIKAELEKAFNRHIGGVAKFVSQSKFEDAKAELGRVSALDSRLGHVHGVDVTTATYSLYFQWAKVLAAKGSAQDANDKLDIAISLKKSDEAAALRKKLKEKMASENKGPSFDAALPEIDKFIAKGDLLGANKRITAAARLTTDKSKLRQLDPRRAKLVAALGDIYEKGVADYRAENFKSAIEELSVVVGIDSDYQQASDYLGKAKEKQKLLDQFSN